MVKMRRKGGLGGKDERDVVRGRKGRCCCGAREPGEGSVALYGGNRDETAVAALDGCSGLPMLTSFVVPFENGSFCIGGDTEVIISPSPAFSCFLLVCGKA